MIPLASGGSIEAGGAMFVMAMVGVLVTMFLALARAAIGPTVFDRVLAANMFGTKTVLLIAVAGFMMGRPEWLDLAIVYALVNFTGTIAVAKYCRFGNLGSDLRGERR
jgi:multicomponent Na+:H+ antiporter subunit F